MKLPLSHLSPQIDPLISFMATPQSHLLLLYCNYVCSPYSPSDLEELECADQVSFTFKFILISYLPHCKYTVNFGKTEQNCAITPIAFFTTVYYNTSTLYYNLFSVNLSRESFPIYSWFCSLLPSTYYLKYHCMPEFNKWMGKWISE